jgi:hypothetical protein
MCKILQHRLGLILVRKGGLGAPNEASQRIPSSSQEARNRRTDFAFSTEPLGKNLYANSHLLASEGRAMSELKVSATIFHVPSDCFTQTAMSLPSS